MSEQEERDATDQAAASEVPGTSKSADPAPTSSPSPDEPEEHSRLSRLKGLARRVLDHRELAEDTKDLLYAVMDTSDRAKSELVKMTAREVRHYLEALRLKEDLMKLVTSHSLEISLRLKPLKVSPSAEASEEDSDA